MTRSSVSGQIAALAVLIIALLIAFAVGRYPISPSDVVSIIAAKLTGGTPDVPGAAADVILHVRGSRVLAAVLIGAALAVAGTAFQGLFRNPLVSPDLLGASSGAAL